MELKSTYQLSERFYVNEVIDDYCTVTIVDLGSEKLNKDEDGNKTYAYDAVEVKVINNLNYIKGHLDYLWKRSKTRK